MWGLGGWFLFFFDLRVCSLAGFSFLGRCGFSMVGFLVLGGCGFLVVGFFLLGGWVGFGCCGWVLVLGA